MSKKMRVGVIFGGRSGEHEVSLVSADSVIKSINKAKYEVVPIGITKQGQWLTTGDPLKSLKVGQFKKLPMDNIITPDATKKSLVRISDNNFSARDLPKQKLDVVFPVLHGTYGEDGAIQGLLELADIPYVGASVLGSAIGMDKVIQKQLFQQNNLPVIPYIFFLKKELKQKKQSTLNAVHQLGLPIFVKPANLGSSVGITKVNKKIELLPAIQYALKYDRKIIIEKAVPKPREIEVAVLGNDKLKASTPGEVISSNEFYDYNAKYVDGQSRLKIPALLPKKISNQIKTMAIKAFQIVDCSGMARVDFLLSNNKKLYLSEVNTIPGFTSISMYPKLWQATGLSYPKLIEQLITLAIERHKEKSKLLTSYQPKQKWYR